ncbi:MAG: hypothetical protein U0998_00790 [Moraxellaceae bacterium]|nr:hypothetical protein [Moraxellaceae bacterium]MDZ4385737.1 hypothetical protein [Moraxellaceae bacterium]
MADKSNLRQQLKELIERDTLSASEQDLFSSTKTPAARSQIWRVTLGMAAALVILLSIWQPILRFQPSQADFLLRVSEEVVTNHTRVKPLDVTSSSYDAVQQNLPMLDFSLQQSALLVDKGLKLVGGRYCTLQGVIATQLVFEDSLGNRVTLYQASYDEKRFGNVPQLTARQAPATVIKQGLKINIWQESGVILALAQGST